VVVRLPSSIYWGALVSGSTAYNHYYGGERSWGDAPWDLTSWDRFEHGGKTLCVMHYGQPGPWGPWNQTALDLTALNHCVSRGAIPLMDLGRNTDDFSGIIAGTYDAAITTWATNIAAWGKPLFLRPWWEMNGSWFGWGQGGSGGLSVANYIAMFQRFRTLCDAAGATNISWIWCPNYILATGAPVSLLASLYPGDAYVDWLGFDAIQRRPELRAVHLVHRHVPTHLRHARRLERVEADHPRRVRVRRDWRLKGGLVHRRDHGRAPEQLSRNQSRRLLRSMDSRAA